MEHFEEGVRVGPSPCGRGVFALRAFAAHELMGPILGTVVDDPQYESEYCMELGDHSVLEPDSPFRYVNHSCSPNCALIEIPPDQHASELSCDGILWLEVLNEILPGEQVTIDYAWPARAAIRCQCGSSQCRGWIVAEESLARLVTASAHLIALKQSPRRVRHHLRRLYRLWAKWNVKFFGGELTAPQIVLGRFRDASRYGACGPASNPGSLSQIRLQLSLVTGTHPHLAGRECSFEKHHRLVAEVLMHEMVHQWGREVGHSDDRRWRHHGTSFCQKCNDIGRQLRLLPVGTAREARRNPGVASCARWPHNARRVGKTGKPKPH